MQVDRGHPTHNKDNRKLVGRAPRRWPAPRARQYLHKFVPAHNIDASCANNLACVPTTNLLQLHLQSQPDKSSKGARRAGLALQGVPVRMRAGRQNASTSPIASGQPCEHSLLMQREWVAALACDGVPT